MGEIISLILASGSFFNHSYTRSVAAVSRKELSWDSNSLVEKGRHQFNIGILIIGLAVLQTLTQEDVWYTGARWCVSRGDIGDRERRYDSFSRKHLAKYLVWFSWSVACVYWSCLISSSLSSFYIKTTHNSHIEQSKFNFKSHKENINCLTFSLSFSVSYSCFFKELCRLSFSHSDQKYFFVCFALSNLEAPG